MDTGLSSATYRCINSTASPPPHLQLNVPQGSFTEQQGWLAGEPVRGTDASVSAALVAPLVLLPAPTAASGLVYSVQRLLQAEHGDTALPNASLLKPWEVLLVSVDAAAPPHSAAAVVVWVQVVQYTPSSPSSGTVSTSSSGKTSPDSAASMDRTAESQRTGDPGKNESSVLASWRTPRKRAAPQ